MTAQFNKEGREIWFQPILWSWMPSHRKGWAFLGAVIAGANASVWILIGIVNLMGQADAIWPFLILFPFFALSWCIAGRHSPSKGAG